MKLTACVLTHNNDEMLLRRCLQSLYNTVDEILILDDFSEDNTVLICKEYTNKIYQRKLNNNFAEQRNFIAKKAKGKWILMLDADESLSSEFRENLQKMMKTEYQAYNFPRTVYCGKKRLYSEVFLKPHRVTRLYRKDKCKYIYPVHEEVITKGRINYTNYYIIHINKQTLKKEFQFAKIEATDMNKHSGFKRRFPLLYSPIAFIETFFYFIINGALEDGIAGLKFSFFQAFNRVLVCYCIHQKKTIERLPIMKIYCLLFIENFVRNPKSPRQCY